MTKLEDIEKAVEELQARLWDQQIERDIKAGKLDWLAEKALADHKAGRSYPLDELMAQCDVSKPSTNGEREWQATPRVGQEEL